MSLRGQRGARRGATVLSRDVRAREGGTGPRLRENDEGTVPSTIPSRVERSEDYWPDVSVTVIAADLP